MLKNYLTIALRTLRRHRGYAFINIAGLAVGMACCIVIFLFVRNERSFDTHHERADRIYRVINERHSYEGMAQRAVTPPALGPTLQATFPEVERTVRLFDMGRQLVTIGEERYFEPGFYLADSTLFGIFTLPLLRGDATTALTRPFSVVISQTIARKYFGDADPLGQTIVIPDDRVLTITGVMADLPPQSHLTINFVGSFSSLNDMVDPERLENWIWQQFYTYVLLPGGYDPAHLEAKLPAFVAEHAEAQTRQREFWYRFYLQPLPDVYLHSANLNFDNSGPRGNATYVYASSLVAVFILLIACFNFMNMATARSMQRAREVGLRKAMGAGRGQLIKQFLGESLVLALFAFIAALFLAALALPAFNAFAGKALTLFSAGQAPLLLGLLAAALLVGVLAGSYPALFLSGFQPTQALKGTLRSGAFSLTGLRKGLVVIQFTISMVLLIGTGIVIQQVDYVRSKQLGFDQEQVVILPLRGDEMRRNVEAIKEELLRLPGITAATASYGVPGGINAGDDVRLPGSATLTPTNIYIIDHDYVETYGMEVVAGRDFSEDFPSDADHGFLINEAAVGLLGWASPEEAVGRALEWDMWGEDSVKVGTVLGVVGDFHFRSLHQQIQPLVLHIYPSAFESISARLRPADVQATLAALRETWKTWAPEWPFEYDFLDEDLAAQYRSEAQFGRLFAAFAALAILIACLGLLGLASFTAARRTKEIGVRKVLGATVPGIVLLLSREFLRLLGIAFVLAVPAGYFAMQGWLDDFAYRVSVGPGVFLLAGLGTLATAWLTIGYQSIRAARANPVETLRYE